jgi:hypothetical protein
MRGFARRQAERERIREERQKNEAPRKPKPEGLPPNMKTIDVTYRAVFEGPQGAINPIGAKIPGAFPMEVFRRGKAFYARNLAAPGKTPIARLGNDASAEGMKRTVSVSFKTCIAIWSIYGTPPDEQIERELLPFEFLDIRIPGKVGWYEPRDRTHIIHALLVPEGARVPPPACGAKVKTDTYIDPRANVEPTCPKCAAIWKQEYKGK